MDETLQANINFIVEQLRRGQHTKIYLHLTPDLNGKLSSYLLLLIQKQLGTPLQLCPVAFSALANEFREFPLQPTIIPGGLLYGPWYQQLHRLVDSTEQKIYQEAHPNLFGDLINLMLNQAARLEDAYYLPAYRFSFTDEEKEIKCREWAALLSA